MARLHLDCHSGMAGNMLVGLCLDLGVSFADFTQFIDSLGLSNYKFVYEKRNKQGVLATYFDVQLIDAKESSRFLPEIQKIITQSSAPDHVKAKAIAVFQRLGEAEAKVHGISPEEVHFHEVGAVDAIVDIVGACWCLDQLGIDSISGDNLHTGRGWVKCAHGIMPVPAPATAELLLKIPYTQGETDKELLTPTGAALLAEWVSEWSDKPSNFKADQIGYGAGGWDLEYPNVVRGYLEKENTQTSSTLWMLETQVDDQNPQFLPELQESLLALGASDVWLTPIIMKKGRPGTLLSLLIFEDLREDAEEIIFQRISTLGIRRWPVDRTILERSFRTIEIEGQTIAIKEGQRNDKIYSQTPEWEDCRKAAKELGKSPRDIWLQAIAQIQKPDK